MTSMDEEIPTINVDEPPIYEPREESVKNEEQDIKEEEEELKSNERHSVPKPEQKPPKDQPAPEASSSNKPSYSIPIIVSLQRKHPKGIIPNRPGFILLGDPFCTLQKVVLLPSNITFTTMRDLLTQRMKNRRLWPLDDEREKEEDLKIYRHMHLGAKAGASLVVVDEFSWEAARELLLTKEEAVLSFGLAAVDKEYETREVMKKKIGESKEEGGKENGAGEGKKRKGKCVVQ